MSGRKIRAVTLSTLMVVSVFAGVVSLTGPGLAATGNVSLSINDAGDTGTVTVSDSDLNTNAGVQESTVVNVESSSEQPPIGSKETTSDTSDGGTQSISISPKALVADRNNDNTIDAADFTLSGASDESISSVGAGGVNYDVTISDAGNAITDNNNETVSYTKLTAQSTGSDTSDGSSTTITTDKPVGDRNGDGVIDTTDVKLFVNSSDETITSVTRNTDGTADVTISDSGGTADSSETTGVERIAYLQSETAVLTETGPDTGTFDGTFSIDQTDSNGVLYATDGDSIDATYWDGGTRRTASETLSVSSSFINGTVTNSSGSAVGSAPVYAIPPSGSTVSGQTDANGDYSLTVSPNTNYDVIVDDYPDHRFEVKTGVSVSKSSTKVVDFQVKAYPDQGTITGTLVDSDGNPVQSTTVSARDTGYRFSGEATTDSNGDFSISVPAATYIVRAPGSPPKTVDGVTVQEGQTTDLGQIQLPEAGYISGTVTNASGSPQKNVGVVADSGDQILHRSTDSNGDYNITVPPGDYTVSVFARGQDAGSKEVTVSGGATSTADFTLKKTTVVDSSVEIVSGSGQESNVGIAAGVRAGMLQVRLTNKTAGGGGGVGGPPAELEGLGVTDSTEFRMEVTVTNFTASSLMWGVEDAQWSTADNATVTNGTDITIRGTPVTLQAKFGGGGGADTGVGPLMFKDPSEVSWPTGRNDRATAGRNQTVYFGVFDLGNMPGSVQNTLNGMSVTTNAQRFSTPSVVNDSLRVWVAAPTKTVDGVDHNGFYKAEIPDAQLDEWDVDDPESELNALYKGDPANFTVTETSTGATVLLENISYSAGFAEVEAAPETGGDDSGGGGGGAVASTSATVQQIDGGVTATIERVTIDDPTVSISVAGATAGGLSVTEASATFGKASNNPNSMSVRASAVRPTNVPHPGGDDPLGYVTVDVEGSLADSVTRGSFTLDLSGSGIDPETVTARRYHDGEWQPVETRVRGERVVVETPGFSVFAIGTEESESTPTPAATPTRTPTPEPGEPAPTPEETTDTATDTPDGTAETVDATTQTPTPAVATPTPTPSPGGSGPGFGVLAALVALLAGAVAARWRA